MATAGDAASSACTDVEIIIFELNDVYGLKTASIEKAFDAFMEECECLDPEDAEFRTSAKAIYYVESSSNRPHTVMMVCTVTDELVARVKQGLAARKAWY